MRTLAVGLLLVVPLSAGAQIGEHISYQMDKQTMEGLDAIYEMDFDRAEVQARRVVEMAPKHPLGHFALGCVAFVRYVYDTEQTDQSLIAGFEAAMNTSIKVAEAWAKKHPDDSYGLMFLSSSYGIWSRLAIARKEWIKGYLYGRKAVKIMERAIAADPENYDAKLGVAMYDYYTDVYPHFIGVLAKIVLRGNRQRGIDGMKIVAEKGHFSKMAARLLLVEIYTMDPFGHKNPPEAVRLTTGIRKIYPKSPMLHAAHLVSLYEDKKYDEVLKGVAQYQAAVKKGVYRPIDAAKGHVIEGTTLWAMGSPDKALETFRRGSSVRLGSQLSRWSVWALIRAGQVADLLSKHELARKLFRSAAEEPDYWGLYRHSKPYVKKPFKGDGLPGSVHAADN